MATYAEVWDDWEVLDQLHEEMDNNTEDGQEVVGRRRHKVVTGKLVMEFIYFNYALPKLLMSRGNESSYVIP